MRDRSTARALPLLLLLLAVALLAQRWLILDRFAFRYTDHDQVVMWYGATEFRHLGVHEPRFYGQDYNTMLEAALAAPLVALRVPHAYALPLVTSVLALAPFLSLAVAGYRRRLHSTAVACLALPLALPLRYHLITSMPRGFVTGVFVASLALLVGLSSLSRRGAFCFGLLGGLSVSVLPNALLLVVPLSVWFALVHRKQTRLLSAAALGGLVAGAAHAATQLFYVRHPDATFLADEHSVWAGLVGPGTVRRLVAVADGPGAYLADVLPAGLGGRWAIAIAILAPPCLLWLTRRRVAAVASAVGVGLLGLAFGLARIHLGSASILYPWSRHFLALPLTGLLYLLWWEEGGGADGKRVAPAICAAGLVIWAGATLSIQTRSLDAAVEREVAERQGYLVGGRTDAVYHDCRRLALDLRSTRTRVVVFDWNSSLLLDYACGAILDESVVTLCPEYDRRTWLLRQQLSGRPGQFLLYGFGWKLTERVMERFADGSALVETHPSVVLVRSGGRRLDDALSELGLRMRPLGE